MYDRNRAGPKRLTLSGTVSATLLFALVIFITPAVNGEACLDCHEEMAESIKGTTHEHPIVACASCHRGDDHAEDPSTSNITIPGHGPLTAQLEACTSCHQPHLEMDQTGFDPHQGQGTGCVSCHQIHKRNDRLLLDSSGEFCGSCHTGVERQFERLSAHPLEDGTLACWSCHDFTGAQPNLGHGTSESCLDCHSDLAGPFMYEHEATSSFTTESGGCISCHNPHGSSNERMLKQPGNSLCRQCHGVPIRHATAHNGAYANLACVECHSEIHGSHEDADFLDPMMGAKLGDGPDGCFCHTGGN